MAVMRNISHD